MNKKDKKILLWANIIMILMIIVHDADHIRQANCWGYIIPLSVWLVNISVYMPSLIALYLLKKEKSSTANATVINGLLVGAAFAQVHLWGPTFPIWGIWNKSFFVLGADATSWTILVITIVVGIAVAMAGNFVRGRQSIYNEN